MKKRIVLLLLITSMVFFVSCNDISRHGLQSLLDSKGNQSENHITSRLFMNLDFLNDFPYADGDYYYRYQGIITNELDRSFAWLSYREDIYAQAKEKYLSTYLPTEFESHTTEACGFTFLFIDRYFDFVVAQFPFWFIAFGYNDADCTLVFIGFCCYGRKDESEYVSLAETDFGAFLEHFYGEWYDWKLSD